ncbi:MAG: TIGR01459 family HAD-type hydrolase [Pseudomonadota bacterium]
MSVKLIHGVEPLAHAYDGFILDLWGVLYDGGQVFGHALDVLVRLKALDKRLVILSNGPRRAAEVEKRIAGAGIARDRYDAVMSSGEEAWLCLKGEIDDPWYRELGPRVFYIGADSDRAMLDGLDVIEAENVADADFILDIGPFDPADTISDYQDMLAAAAAHHVPMVCANPDLVVHRLGNVEICAGGIAERYEELGGRVRWHGKPHPSIYESGMRLMGGIEKSRLLAVGDSFRTDIRGANAAGIDSLFVVEGIHREDLLAPDGAPDEARLAKAVARAGAVPTYATQRFLWGA